jgi:predicted RNA-binding Zn-ribbon protein involved in translation (DUF1610 family)
MTNLNDQVNHIVNQIENSADVESCTHCGTNLALWAEGDYSQDCPDCGEEIAREMNGYDYLSDVLDIEYIVGSDKTTLLGARILVTFGGPNIWINTKTKQVEGAWWGESVTRSYHSDAMDLEGTVEELFAC